MKEAQSIIRDVINQIFEATNKEEAERILVSRIQSSSIPRLCKQKMMRDIMRVREGGLVDIQSYAANAMLAKEGNRVIH